MLKILLVKIYFWRWIARIQFAPDEKWKGSRGKKTLLKRQINCKVNNYRFNPPVTYLEITVENLKQWRPQYANESFI